MWRTFLRHLQGRLVRFTVKTNLGGRHAELRDGGLVNGEKTDFGAAERGEGAREGRGLRGGRHGQFRRCGLAAGWGQWVGDDRKIGRLTKFSKKLRLWTKSRRLRLEG